MTNKTLTYLIILIVIITFIISAGFAFYNNIQQTQKEEAYSSLSTLSQLKISQVINWRAERLSDATFIQRNKFFRELLQKFLVNKDISVKPELIYWLQPVKDNHEYLDIVIIDTSFIPHSLFSKDYILHFRDSIFLSEAVSNKKILIQGLHNDSHLNRITMGAYIPFFTDHEDVMGYIKILIDPKENLFPLIESVPTTSQTSESFLVRIENDSVVYLNNLRFKKNTALTFKLPLSIENLPAVMAVKGFTGIVEGVDYNGNEVLADLGRIPDSPWFIVSKINLSEVNAPVNDQAFLIFTSVAGLIMLCIFIFYSFWRFREIGLLNELIRSEQILNLIMDNVNEGILVAKAPDGQVLAVSKWSINHTLGRDSDAVINLPLQEYLTQWDVREFSSGEKPLPEKLPISRALKGEMISHEEWLTVRPDGTSFIASVNAVPVKDPGTNKIFAVVSTWQDITERKQIELKLEELLNDLKRSNKDLEQFAYSASHDLQEPIRMIKSYSQLISFKYSDRVEEGLKEFLGFINEGATRMEVLVSDLLKYSRISTNKSAFELVSCNTVMKEVLMDLKFRIEEENAVITCDDLPVIKGIQSLLRQLFQNFIQNSLKFRSERNPEIHIGCEQRDHHWLFYIRDNGIGIEEQFFDRIFVIFQRLHSRDKYPGTGIGLAICKKIVERHGGQVCVESKPGEGTIFYFTIPKVSSLQSK